MNISPVLSPSGEPMFSVGGNQAYKTAVKHGYVVSLEWIRLGKHTRAAMCIGSPVSDGGRGLKQERTRALVQEHVVRPSAMAGVD